MLDDFNDLTSALEHWRKAISIRSLQPKYLGWFSIEICSKI